MGNVFNFKRYLAVALLLSLVFAFGCTGGGGTGQQDVGPKPVASLTAKATAGGIEVDWNPSPSPDVAGYNIYRSAAAGQLGSKINPAMLKESFYNDSSAQDGTTYYYTVRAVNTKGTEGTDTTQVSATVQAAPPSGLIITIDGGATYATSAKANLTLYANKASQCRFSNDGTTYGDWESYSTQKQWDLSTGDGVKTVYFQCRNAVGTLSQAAGASITLRTSGPSITISSPAQGDVLPTHFNLTFTVAQATGSVSCNAYADGFVIPVGSVEAGKAYTVPVVEGDGGHSVHVQCTDGVAASNSSTVQFMTEANPITVTVNDGGGQVASASVTLRVHAPSASLCRFSNDNSKWTGWETYAATRSWTLTAGDGKKTVYAECKTSAGNSLGVASDDVSLMSTISIYMSINNDDQYANSRTVLLAITAPTATQCRFGNGGPYYGAWESYSQSRWWTLPSGNGRKTVYVECMNSNGASGSTYASITLNDRPQDAPSQLYVSINGGAQYTSSRFVTLSLDAYNADDCRYRNENLGWSQWQYFTKSLAWTLSSGDGGKTVYYQCRNDYGESDVHSAGITVGSSNPTLSITNPKQGYVYSGQVDLSISTGGSGTLNCAYYCNGGYNDFGSVTAGQGGSHLLLAPLMGGVGSNCGTPTGSNGYSTYVTCSDQYGHTATSSSVSFTWNGYGG